MYGCRTGIRSEPRRSASCRPGQRGSALAEFAIVWFPLIALLFGIADVSRMMFMRNLMQNAVREAVRHAVSHQTSYAGAACTSTTECAQTVVRRNTLGFLDGPVAGKPGANFIKVLYYAPDRLNEPLPLTDAGAASPANQPGNLLEVRVENYPVSWLVPLPVSYLGGAGMLISASASDVVQPLPNGLQELPKP